MLKPHITKKWKRNIATYLPIIIILLISATLVGIFIGDLLDLANTINVHLRFDWAMIICTFMSAVATFTLATISIRQNEKLSNLNEKSLETAKKNNGYSLINFRKRQCIEEKGKLLKLKLYDTKNIPLKYAEIRQIEIKSLKEKYMESDEPKITLTNNRQKIDLEFTPKNPENPEDFYFANARVNFPFEKFNKGDFLRLELDIGITNTLGVSTIYKYFILTQILKKTEKNVELDNYYEYNYCKDIKVS